MPSKPSFRWHSGSNLLTAAAAVLALTVFCGSACAGSKPLTVQILAKNDFHGQISPGQIVSGHPAGSAPVLASYLKNAMIGMKNRTVIVSAGDLVGASAVVSGLLQDEPSIMFFNMLGNAYCGAPHQPSDPRCNLLGIPGNHEFDEGLDEFYRLLRGGNHAKGPFLENPWKGAAFPVICANIVNEGKQPILPPFLIKKVGRVRIGFIGAVLKEAPSMVSPGGVRGLTFLDEAESINHYVKILKAEGIRTIIAVVHQGGTQTDKVISGDIVNIVNRLDDEVDVVISAHSHTYINGLLKSSGGRDVLVTQAWSKGIAYADIDLEIDRITSDVIGKTATIVTTRADAGPGLTPDKKVRKLAAAAEKMVEPIVNRPVGTAAADILKSHSEAGESALGNLIADAQRAAMGTDFAFMNPGGIRADISAGEVTWGELYTAQPFHNTLIKMSLTGRQVYDLLEQQWLDQPYARILQVSGLKYAWDGNLPAGSRITAVFKSDNTPLHRDDTAYTVAVNSFLADGGDNFTVLENGAGRVAGPVDLDALVSYIKGLSQPFFSVIENRITRLH